MFGEIAGFTNVSRLAVGFHVLQLNRVILEPLYWKASFPFIHARISPAVPSNYYGVGNPYCGILLNYPVVWFALAIIPMWRRHDASETLALRWFSRAALVLFVSCGLTLCCFFCGSSSYLCDFMPVMVMLAIIGACSLEQTLKGSGRRRGLVRAVWCILLIYSMSVSFLVGCKTHAYSNFTVGNSLSNGGRSLEAIEHLKKSIRLDPTPSSFYLGLGDAYFKAGETDKGIIEVHKAIERDPKNTDAIYDLSMALFLAGRVDEGARDFQNLIEANPNYLDTKYPGTEALNNVAWSLATNPDPTKRNGRIAVLLAESACRRSGFKATLMVGTLAAAYAEAGRFDDAISTAEKACALASGAEDGGLLKKNQRLLSLYQTHEPYHEEQ